MTPPNNAFNDESPSLKFVTSFRIRHIVQFSCCWTRRLNIQDNGSEFVTQSDVSNDIQHTPRWLLVLIGTTTLLLVVGIVIGIFAFRTALRPGQQQRVIQMLPFMESLLPTNPGAGSLLPTNPGAGLALPTPLATYATGVSPAQLLTPMYATETPEATVVLASPA